jgi:hypothetical protein
LWLKMTFKSLKCLRITDITMAIRSHRNRTHDQKLKKKLIHIYFCSLEK